MTERELFDAWDETYPRMNTLPKLPGRPGRLDKRISKLKAQRHPLSKKLQAAQDEQWDAYSGSTRMNEESMCGAVHRMDEAARAPLLLEIERLKAELEKVNSAGYGSGVRSIL